MASAFKTVLTLGASHLSVSSFSNDTAGGLILENVVHHSLNADPALKDQWIDAVGVALSQVALSTPLKSINRVLLPAWAVLTKLLKVTRIEGEGQREVVRFEAANALPNGLEEFEWTYTILRDDGFEREVLVQAVASSFMTRLLNMLKDRGIRPSIIDALISSEWTALRSQYGKEEGASVLLDVGARSVTLTVMADQEVPFIRSFNFGGNLVTQALARQSGKSFVESERSKLEWVRSPGGGVNLDLLNQASEGFVNRLVNEVQRSLALYRRQGQSGNPARILLAGGASQLPGLADFLERKSGISTSFYDPFRGISSGPGLPAAQTSQVSYALVAPIGMVSNESDSYTNNANLLPDSLSSQLKLSEKKPWLAAAGALFLLAGLMVGLKYHMQAWDVESRIVSLEAELAPLESLSLQVKEAYDSYTRLSALTEAKEDLLQKQQYWIVFLADLQGRLSQVQDVWLESIQPEVVDGKEEPQRLRVTGRLLDRNNPLSLVSSNSRGRVEVLLGSFENSPFIQSVDDRRFDTSRPGILRFDFSLTVNPGALF